MEERPGITQKSICPKTLMRHLKIKYGGPVRFCKEKDFEFERLCEILEDGVTPTEHEYLTLLDELRVSPNMLAPPEEDKKIVEILYEIIGEKLIEFTYGHDDATLSTEQFSRAFARLVPFILPRKNDLGNNQDNAALVEALIKMQEGKNPDDVASDLVEKLNNRREVSSYEG